MNRYVLLAAVVLGVLAATSAAGTVAVVVAYPSANLHKSATLAIRGDACGLNWSTGQTMVASETNEWTIALTCPSSGVLQFKVLVDDSTWQIGANEFFSLSAAGGLATVYPWFYSVNGSYSTIKNVWSPQINNSRNLVVYVPPSYAENSLKRYANILLMQDGQNLFDPKTSAFGVAWMCQDTVNVLVSEGRMDEVILVGVDNTALRMEEYTYSVDLPYSDDPLGNQYLDFLEQTVMPIVLKSFRVAEGYQLGILGSSLGGLISCYGGYTRPSVFTKTGCMSTSFWWNNQDFDNTIMVETPRPPLANAFYLDDGTSNQGSTGSDDELLTLAVRTHFETLGFTLNQTLFYYVQQGGEHSEKYWGERFWVPMTDLYPVPLQQLA